MSTFSLLPCTNFTLNNFKFDSTLLHGLTVRSKADLPAKAHSPKKEAFVDMQTREQHWALYFDMQV